MKIFLWPAFIFVVLAPYSVHAEVGAEGDGHHKSKNHFSIISGSSVVPDHDLDAVTFGFDFERELTPHLGLGIVAEHAFGELDATSIFAVADVHVGRGLVLQLGPGVEFIDGKSLAVGRVGVFQELHLGEFVVAPSVSYDFTKEENTLVLGVALGTRF